MLLLRAARLPQRTGQVAHVPECYSRNRVFTTDIIYIVLKKTFAFTQCWKSRVRDGYGVERVSRGCKTSEEQLPINCNQNNYNLGGPRKRHTAGHYNIECCTGDYCNSGDFPELTANDFSEYRVLLNDDLIVILAF